MYWWDYASFQFVGMFVIGLFCGWAITEARAAGAPRGRRARQKAVRGPNARHRADLATLEARLAASLRRLEALEIGRAEGSIIQLAARRVQRSDVAA